MATYKGIGFDTTNATNRTGLAADKVEFTPLLKALNSAQITGDCSVSGNLDVSGDIISRGAVDLVVQDNFIDLNFANSTTTAESGGLTIQMNRNSGFTASTVTTFVAGAAGVSNPTFTNTDATGSTLLAAGDVVVISGATDAENDGIYVVSAVSGASFPQTVTIKGTGTVATNAATPWAQTQFTAASGNTATAFKTDIFIQLVADGTAAFSDSGGSAYSKGTFLTSYKSNATESSFSANGSYTTVESTLQSAYNGGGTITTASSTDIALTLASGDLTATGAGAVLFTPTAASSFTSGAALTLTAGSASTWSTGAGALTLTSAAACTWSSAAGLLTIDGAGGISLAGNSSEIDITTTGAVDINGAGITVDGTTLSVDSTDTTNLTMTANAASTKTMTIAATNSNGANVSNLDVDADGSVDIDGASGINIGKAADVAIDIDSSTLDIDSSGAVTIDGTAGISIDGSGAASNLTSTGQDLTVSTATSGTLALTGAALVDINAGANLDVDVTGTVDILASSTFSIDGTGASNVTATSGALTLSTATSGDIDITAADDVNIAAAGSDVDIDSATLTVDTTAGISLDAATASNFTTAAGALTLDGAGGVNIAGNAAEVDITTTAAVDVNSGAGTWNASTLALDGTDNVTLEMSANVASAKTLKIKASNSDGGGTAAITVDAPEVTISASLLGQFSAFEALSNAAFAKGDVLYMLATTGKVDKSDADAILTSRILGVAGKAASGADEDIPVVNYGRATVVADAVVAASKIGQPCYVSLTAGKVTMTPPTAAGDVVYQVGIVVLADGGTGIDVLLQPQFILENG